LINKGATNSQYAVMGINATPEGYVAQERIWYIGTGTSTEDSTASKSFSITGQYADASSLDNITISSCIITN
jgi:hypothetical protein